MIVRYDVNILVFELRMEANFQAMIPGVIRTS